MAEQVDTGTRGRGVADRAGSDRGGLTARRAAVALLRGVFEDGALLSALIDAPDGPLSALAPEDRARAQRLALAVLRHADPADAVLKPFLRKLPDARARQILRLAAVEICAEGVAPHAAVGAAVALMGEDRKTAHLSGLANAVLRRVASEGTARWTGLPPQRLPGWLRGRMQSAWGAKVTAAIEAVHAMTPPVDLTAKGYPEALAAATGGTLLPTGSVRLDAGRQISALSGYGSGKFWVQDAAAALPARVLAARAGERVLDLCAAPGGKTLQLAAAGADVTALDVSEPRLGRLHDNLARTRLAAEVVVADALDWQGGPFDAVLLDPPCSATGTIRRHPDLPFVKTAADLKPLAVLQAALLDRAIQLTRPGGRLVFCTCSLLPEEGEAQASAVLGRHPELHPDAAAFDRSWIDPAWRTPLGLRLRPDHWAGRGGIDGFFIAAFRRSG
ncbi:MAG: methyltransferase domain-containing protein [Rhodobacteraceae bacterium]|nr:methyltransferase domain-containing protein [Paracoccaceae bacterium]